MKITSRVLWILVLVAVPCGNVRAASLDCRGGIVSVGDSRVDLLMKCGEPAWKDSHDEEIIERSGQGAFRKLVVTVDEWTYNFGTSQFLRIVTLKNGRIADVRTTGNYGSGNSAKTEQRECTAQVVSTGDTKSEVLLKCGEPTWKDMHQEESLERVDRGVERRVYDTVEEWTYNLGPSRFVRILTFRNNNLVDIRTGGYGYQMLKKDEK